MYNNYFPTVKEIEKKPKQVWKRKKFQAEDSPFIEQSMLFISKDHSYHAIDWQTGRDIWTTELPGKGTKPTIDGDAIYVGGRHIDNFLYVMNKNSGEIIHKYRTSSSNGNINQSPLLLEDQIILAAGKRVHSLNRSNYKKQWSTDLNSGRIGYYPLCYSNNMVFSITNLDGVHNRIICCQAEDGEILWKSPKISIMSELIPINGYLFYLDRQYNLQIADPSTGTVVQSIKLIDDADCAHDSYLVTNGKDLIIAINNNILSLDLTTGQMKWHFKAKTSIGQPTLGARRVYYATAGEGLFAHDIQTGSIDFHISTKVRSKRAIGLADGMIFLAGSMNEHELLAFKG